MIKVKQLENGFELNITLTSDQLEVLQNALGYAAWQFEEGRAWAKADIKFINDVYKKIQKQTGVKGVY